MPTEADRELTAVELARLVRRTRSLQTLYFKTRTQGALKQARESEGELDLAVRRLLDPPDLFGEPR